MDFFSIFLHLIAYLFLNSHEPGQLYLEATSLEGVVGPEICALNLNSFETDCSRNKEIECTCCTQCQNNL